MIRAYLKRLHQYDDWANVTLLSGFEEQKVSLPEIDKIFSHAVAAKLVWIERINGKQPSISAYGLYTMEHLRQINIESTALWLDFLQNSPDEQLFGNISYSNSQKVAYTSPVIDIAGHVVNHASYHRGQIAKLMRQAGFEPLVSNFIDYSRIMDNHLKPLS